MFENGDQFLTPGSFGRLRLWGGEYDGLWCRFGHRFDQARKVLLTVEARIVRSFPRS